MFPGMFPHTVLRHSHVYALYVYLTLRHLLHRMCRAAQVPLSRLMCALSLLPYARLQIRAHVLNGTDPDLDSLLPPGGAQAGGGAAHKQRGPAGGAANEGRGGGADGSSTSSGNLNRRGGGSVNNACSGSCPSDHGASHADGHGIRG